MKIRHVAVLVGFTIMLGAVAWSQAPQQCPQGCQTQITDLQTRVGKLEQQKALTYSVDLGKTIQFQDVIPPSSTISTVQGLQPSDMVFVVLRRVYDVARPEHYTSTPNSAVLLMAGSNTTIPLAETIGGGTHCNAGLSIDSSGQVVLTRGTGLPLKEPEAKLRLAPTTCGGWNAVIQLTFDVIRLKTE